MKILNGADLAGYIKERQVHTTRGLLQALHVEPTLAIIVTVDNPVIDIYIRLKERYGADLGVRVIVHRIEQAVIRELIESLNNDETVHGIIVQLPLFDTTKTREVVNLIRPDKDVDALGEDALYDPATPTAILWLLAGYNQDLRGKKILLLGRGTLVGSPLEKMLLAADLNVSVVDRSTKDLREQVLQADLIISATGSPSILKADMIAQGAIVVDAGVASENGKSHGDVDDAVFERDDLTITPAKGGVGPLTVCALFENVLSATRNTAAHGG